MKGEIAIREFCLKHKYSDRIVEKGLPYLVSWWEKTAKCIDKDTTSILDEYINNIDCRVIIDRVWHLCSDVEIMAFNSRITTADDEFERKTELIYECLGSSVEKLEDFSPAKYWYSFRIPFIRRDEYLLELKHWHESRYKNFLKMHRKPNSRICPQEFCFNFVERGTFNSSGLFRSLNVALKHLRFATRDFCGFELGQCRRISFNPNDKDYYEPNEPFLMKLGLPWFFFIPSPEKLIDKMRDEYIRESESLWGKNHWINLEIF